VADERETMTAGTTDPSEGEAEGQTSAPGELTAESAQTQEATIDWQKKYLEEGLPAQEERNRLKAEIAELRNHPAQPPDVTDGELDDDDLTADLAATAQFTATDPTARLALKLAKQLQKERAARESLQNDAILVRQLDRMKLDEAKEARVLEHFTKNRRRLGDMTAARNEVENQENAAEVERLRKQVELLSRRPDTTPNAPATHGQTTTTRPAKAETTTREDWEASQAALEFSDPAKFRENQRKVRNREIVIRG
jgi:hypothetical protein